MNAWKCGPKMCRSELSNRTFTGLILINFLDGFRRQCSDLPPLCKAT